MNILDDLRAEWIAIRKSLGDHIAYLEAGNKIHPIGQDPDEATDRVPGSVEAIPFGSTGLACSSSV